MEVGDHVRGSMTMLRVLDFFIGGFFGVNKPRKDSTTESTSDLTYYDSES